MSGTESMNKHEVNSNLPDDNGEELLPSDDHNKGNIDYFNHSDPHHPDHLDAQGNKVLGFFVYLMTDLILFATFFATYAVLNVGVADGPGPKDIFDLKFVLIETFLLLISSITFGFAMLGAYQNNMAKLKTWLIITALFGMGFIGMEIYEFHHLIVEGFGPDRSAFLSSFFSLVGLHGIHVTVGICWLFFTLFQLNKFGLSERMMTRLRCLSLFWHFLDIVWICVFSLVYLVGVAL